MTAPLSRAEILALPPAIDLPTLGRVFGVSEPTIRQANRSRELERLGIRVNRIGAQYRVITASVWAYLGLDGAADGASSEAELGRPARQGKATASALRPVRGERC
jgi:hypothetical protein